MPRQHRPRLHLRRRRWADCRRPVEPPPCSAAQTGEDAMCGAASRRMTATPLGATGRLACVVCGSATRRTLELSLPSLHVERSGAPRVRYVTCDGLIISDGSERKCVLHRTTCVRGGSAATDASAWWQWFGGCGVVTHGHRRARIVLSLAHASSSPKRQMHRTLATPGQKQSRTAVHSAGALS